MRRIVLTAGVALLSGVTAAAESRIERSLKMLALPERLVQLCDYTAMLHVRKEDRKFRPDRAVADATAPAKFVSQNKLEADGGAFRSRGKWYGISYTCSASPDNMKVLSFKHKIGDEIPESKWAAYGLWQ